ncbi:hypothetical protein KP509_30G058300 [Ceratopteris richardii]|nr:hypothetical protein KP509_30G058300 [Ceratopteris richardii]
MLDLQKYFSNARILYGDAYHELGLITMPESFDL